MAGVELILSLLQHASAQGAKSTALNPLIWLSGILVGSLVILAGTKAQTWLLIAIFVLLVLVVLVFLVAFGYFAYTNPDALRSERFTLSKMAIQRSMKGDDLTGIVTAPPEALPSSPPPPPFTEPGGSS